jgi:hypothetical protein
MEKHKNKRLYFIIFISLFVLLFILDKLAGNNPIFDAFLLPTSSSYSWKEMVPRIPFIAITSLLVTLLVWYLKEKKRRDI